ncbi:MAG: ParB N-terminal domain-containing protein, partial [Alphaproteobacteria bacterium]|nr:ParB N-terminal domain-containing protein [Alphaproteobacteria bacterium]
VLNPRVRDAKKFTEIVDSIRKVGLKQPIKVSRTRGADGEVAYNLVCGQGRMEAFQALEQTEIPAIVTDLSEEDSLVASIVENIARSQPRPGDLFRAIGDLVGRGYSDAKIGAKIGYSATHVGRIRRLLKAGEERLLIAVETGKMPLGVAVAIAKAEDSGAQDVLDKAYKGGELTLSQMPRAKSTIEYRERYGKALKSDTGQRKPASQAYDALARRLKEAVKNHGALIESADTASEHLKILVQGLRMLLSEDHFRTLLRAEQMQTMPAPLARLVEAREET